MHVHALICMWCEIVGALARRYKEAHRLNISCVTLSQRSAIVFCFVLCLSLDAAVGLFFMLDIDLFGIEARFLQVDAFSGMHDHLVTQSAPPQPNGVRKSGWATGLLQAWRPRLTQKLIMCSKIGYAFPQTRLALTEFHQRELKLDQRSVNGWEISEI
jgi:hypothetical protein